MPTHLTLTVIGNAPVTGLSDALGINESGQVVGQEDSTFPIVWTPTTPNGTVGASLRLALPQIGGGPGNGTATAINNLGDAVGFVDTLDPSGAPVTRAAFWLAGAGTVAELGTLIPSFSPSGFFLGNSKALGINDSRVIIGVSDSPTGSEHAFVFDPAIGFMRDLGSLVPLSMLPGTPDPSQAQGINNQGDIVGEATAVDASGNLVAHAFLLVAGSFFMQDLGTLLPDPNNPGSFLGDSSAFAITGAGLVVGDSDAGLPVGTNSTPTFFQSGSLPGGLMPAIGAATAVNQNNTIVGNLGAPPSSAFRFDSSTGAAFDLTSALGVPGTNIVRAAGINNANQIAAVAMIGGVSTGVLLTP